MNKQELNNLIANNSIRMTNRQWLESLSDEDLVEWMLADPVAMEFVNKNGKWVVVGEIDKLAPRLQELIRTSNSSRHGVLNWLRAEHKDED